MLDFPSEILIKGSFIWNPFALMRTDLIIFHFQQQKMRIKYANCLLKELTHIFWWSHSWVEHIFTSGKHQKFIVQKKHEIKLKFVNIKCANMWRVLHSVTVPVLTVMKRQECVQPIQGILLTIISNVSSQSKVFS
jgi:hypothetical protein